MRTKPKQTTTSDHLPSHTQLGVEPQLYVFVDAHQHRVYMDGQNDNNDDDLVQVHCCVAMMSWNGIELIAHH